MNDKDALAFYRMVTMGSDWADSNLADATSHKMWDYCTRCRFGSKVERDPIDAMMGIFPKYQKIDCSLIQKRIEDEYPKCTVKDWADKLGAPEPRADEAILTGPSPSPQS